MSWFEAHTYIAAWASALLTLAGFLARGILRPSVQVNWSMVVIYVVCLSSLATAITPGVEPGVRVFVGMSGGLAFGIIAADSLSLD